MKNTILRVIIFVIISCNIVIICTNTTTSLVDARSGDSYKVMTRNNKVKSSKKGGNKHSATKKNVNTPGLKLTKEKVFINTTCYTKYVSLRVTNVSEDRKVEWSVSDPSIAKILTYDLHKGKFVTYKSVSQYAGWHIYIAPTGKSGKTKITASLNGYKKASCAVYTLNYEESLVYYGKTGSNNFRIHNCDVKAVDIIVNSIPEIITKDMSRADKVKAVHDYIIDINSYNTKGLETGRLKDCDYGIAGPMLYHKSVCAGYAKTFYVYLSLLDIPVKYIVGGVDKLGDHAWNMVKMDDNHWYHIDVTWDDADEFYSEDQKYEYYLLTSKQMGQSRIWKK